MKKKTVVLTLFTLAALMSACSKPSDTNKNNINTPSTTQPDSENNAQNNDKNNTTDGSQTSDKEGAVKV